MMNPKGLDADLFITHAWQVGYAGVFPCENHGVSAGCSMVASGNLSWLPRTINTLLAKSTRKGHVP